MDHSLEAQITRFLAGDPDEVDRVRGWISSCTASLRGSLRWDREDVEQEALLSLTQSLRQGRFRGQSSLKTYAYVITRRTAIDHLRSRHRWTTSAPEDFEQIEAEDPSAEHELSARETSHLAMQVYADMPEKCRRLWSMLYRGLSYEEIAEVTGQSQGALRIQVLRCRRKAQARRRKLVQLSAKDPLRRRMDGE